MFKRSQSEEQRTVAGLLETIGLYSKANLSANLLSHGEKQRLEIGMLVAQSPDLLLVDEPAAGLTDEETENVGALLLSLAESHSIIANRTRHGVCPPNCQRQGYGTASRFVAVRR